MPTVLNSRAGSSMVKNEEKVFLNGPMAKNTEGHLKMGLWTDTASSSG
jgi:hypothetical protein